MTILKENKVEELIDIKNMGMVRKVGSLSGWQKQIYNLITVKFADSVFDRMMQRVYKIAPEDANKEDIKNALTIAFLDYVESIN